MSKFILTGLNIRVRGIFKLLIDSKGGFIMKNIIFTAMFLLLLSNFSLAPAQEPLHNHNEETRELFREQPERMDHIFKQPHLRINAPLQRQLVKDNMYTLNAIIPDFQVNENVGGAWQRSSAIATSPNGNFVITWMDKREGNYDIYMQRYFSDGSLLGTNLKVNDDPGNTDQWSPSICIDSSGNFVITWDEDRNGIGDYDIYAQRYASNGSPLGINFRVNDDQGTERQEYPSISTDRNGNFIITWVDRRNGFQDRDIYAQRYSSDGSPIDTNFKVNDDPGTTNQEFPAIAIDSSGHFTITWTDQRNWDYDIYAQRFASNGNPISANFRVNDQPGGAWPGWPAISANGSGDFVISWMDERNGDYDIYAQRYFSDGTSISINFKVNDDPGNADQGYPNISTDGNGNFIISWKDERNGNQDIFTQRYASDGSLLGTNFKVNDDLGSADQTGPSISTNNNGNFVISWTDRRNGDSDIYTQRYTGNGNTAGTNFKVNNDLGSADQVQSSISTDSYGNFIITWQDSRHGNADIYAQRFTGNGSPLDTNFQVNDNLGNSEQRRPVIGSDASGNFVITWLDRRNENYDVYAQRFAHEGNPLGINFKVNDDQNMRWQGYPNISSNMNGNFVVTWEDQRDIWDTYIYAQRYASDGSLLGVNFKVSDSLGYDVQNPSVSVDSSGNFVITWKDRRNGEFTHDIYAQRYAHDGSQLGSNFKVNDDPGNAIQYNPDIVTDKNGNFVITWADGRNANFDIYAQRYASNGSALGMNFMINDDTGNATQRRPSIDSDSSGNFVITWVDDRMGSNDIFSQRFSSNGSLLGSNFRVTNISFNIQNYPDVKLWNDRIYNTWTDNRAGGSGYDIWANVLDWNDPVGIDENELSPLPSAFILKQNFPNPFNPTTVISWQLAVGSTVNLTVYNLAGQTVATLVDGYQSAGNHSIQFDGSGLASGVYLYRLQVGNNVETRKMVLMR